MSKNRSKQIADSNGMRCGSMTCNNCKRDIKGLYLIVNIYDLKSRGNENDKCEIYCFECTKEQNVWKKYFKDKEQAKLDAVKENKKNQQRAIQLIKESSSVSLDEKEKEIYY